MQSLGTSSRSVAHALAAHEHFAYCLRPYMPAGMCLLSWLRLVAAAFSIILSLKFGQHSARIHTEDKLIMAKSVWLAVACLQTC